MIGWSLAGIIVVVLIAIGLAALVAPRRSSVQYGIALDEPRALAFIRAMGIRDVVIGGLLGLIALNGSPQMLGRGLCLAAAIAVIDLAVVTRDRRTASAAAEAARSDSAQMLHALGAVGLILAGAALFAGC